MARRRGNGRPTGKQAPRKALATQAARRSAPASGGVKREPYSRIMIVTSTVTLPMFVQNFHTMDEKRQEFLQGKWEYGLTQGQRDIASAIFLHTRDDEVQKFLDKCNGYLDEGTDDSWNKFISVLDSMKFSIRHAQDPNDDGQGMDCEEETAALKSADECNSIGMKGTCSQSPSTSPTGSRRIRDYFSDAEPGSASASTEPGSASASAEPPSASASTEPPSASASTEPPSASASTEKRCKSKEGPEKARSPSTNTKSQCTESLPASDSTENRYKPKKKPQKAKSAVSITSVPIKKRYTLEKKPGKKKSGPAPAPPSKPISDPTKNFVKQVGAIMAISEDKAMADKVTAEKFADAVLQRANVSPTKIQGIVTFYRRLRGEEGDFRNKIRQHYQKFVNGDDEEKKTQVDHVVAAIKEGCKVA